VVEGDDPAAMHQKMAATMEKCVLEIRAIQQKRGRIPGVEPERPRWPMIILRTPKGWTCPKELDGHKLEGSWRAHQIPITDPVTNPAHLKLVEQWMRSYQPEELFDEQGALLPELKAMAPTGTRRITANPHANGGLLRKPLEMPDFRDYAVKVEKPEQVEVSSTATLANFLAEVMRRNMTSFRVFGPDETASNKLDGI
jgi:xylulose-5-phosphate/fructose-6-phosphate phosphoketolase